jgi:hypothetical protein
VTTVFGPSPSGKPNRPRGRAATEDRKRRGNAFVSCIQIFVDYYDRVNYQEAYEDLLKRLLATLATVETDESVLQFSTQAADSIRAAATEVPEFYVAEFLQMLASAVVQRMQAETEAGKEALKDVKMEEATASVELTARFAAASAAGDKAAQHAIWADREKIQAANQAKVDAVTARMDVLALQLEAFTMLQSTLG